MDLANILAILIAYYIGQSLVFIQKSRIYIDVKLLKSELFNSKT